MGAFIVYASDGTNGYQLSVSPVAWTFYYPIIGDAPDGGTFQDGYAVASWDFGGRIQEAPTDADYAAIIARRGARGDVRFQTLNDTDQWVICTGKIDPYVARNRQRGRLGGFRLDFTRVTVVG